ncbi:MAG: hypothetical protein B6D70_07685 [gamma proteobacterium symbiont of Stewartia floridana]|nr:MAG: hypothetical protein B6D70_07685 [gamma proteobacterium symbiont of Stewartia floridana]
MKNNSTSHRVRVVAQEVQTICNGEKDAMSNSNRKGWSPDEVATLITGYSNGAPVDQIASELGRSRRSVYGKANCLGVIHSSVGEQGYSTEEDAYLAKYAKKKTCAEIGRALGRSAGSVKQRGIRLGIGFEAPEKNARYSKDHAFFDKPNTQNCYVAGLLASDGWVRPESSGKPINQVGIAFAWKDVGILEHFKQVTGYTGPIREFMVDGHPQAELRINGVAQWVLSLRKHWGVIPNKTLALRAPPKSLTRKQEIAYLVGLVEGDGGIRISNKTLRVEYATGSKYFAKWMQRIWAQLVGVSPTLSVQSRNRKNPAYYVTFHGANARKLCEILMAAKVHRMKRKWDVAQREIARKRVGAKWNSLLGESC